MRSCLVSVLLGVLSLVVLGAGAAVLTRSYEMPTKVMEPTVRQGDRLAVIPLWGRPLRRGMVVTFHPPTDMATTIVGRVVGLPGERIRVVDGKVEVNGEQINEPYLQPTADGPGVDFPTFPDKFDDFEEVRKLQVHIYTDFVRNGVLYIPANDCFLLSDHRGFSSDSRRYGPIPTALITGQPIAIYTTAAGGFGLRLL